MLSRVLVRGGWRMQSVKTTKAEQPGPLAWPAKVTGNSSAIKAPAKTGIFPSLRKKLLDDTEKSLLKAEQHRWFPFIRKNREEAPSMSKTTYSVQTSRKEKGDHLVVW
ncbi:unnamed protein product [Oikopleura dioica]|uniref:Uncharacterized protein n=1 Tax=Oikopleura dioica TaxID=34765 RepID=E4XXV7_OIKDI|nr:unnamed protein product [Oikopleura dioica]